MSIELLNIMLPVKRVVDPYVNVRLRYDLQGMDTDNLKRSMNPFDEIAVQAARDFAEEGLAKMTTAVSIGPAECEETLRAALAMGIDQAILVETDQDLQPLTIAKTLHALQVHLKANLVLMGKQAIDNDHGQVGPMLSGMNDFALAICAYEINLDVSRGELNVTREVDNGLEMLSLQLPAVITADLRLKKPVPPPLPKIMQAKSKPLQRMSLEELGIEVEENFKVLQYNPPAEREQGQKIENAEELFKILKSKELI